MKHACFTRYETRIFLDTRREGLVVPHPGAKVHEWALGEVYRADFWCNRRRTSSSVDLEGSRGQVWARGWGGGKSTILFHRV